MATKTLEPASLDLGLPCESESIWEFTPPCALYCSTSWTLTLDLPQMLELFCAVVAVLAGLACCLASFIPVKGLKTRLLGVIWGSDAITRIHMSQTRRHSQTVDID